MTDKRQKATNFKSNRGSKRDALEYGISVSAEAQTFLLAKRPKRQGERRNGCIRGLLCF